LFGPPEADGSLGFVCDLVFDAWDFNDFQRLSFSMGRLETSEGVGLL
jgi:hypothetical protein